MIERNKMSPRNVVTLILMLAFIVESYWIVPRVKFPNILFFKADSELIFFVIRQFEYALKCSISYYTSPSAMTAWPFVTFVFFAMPILQFRSTIFKQVNSFIMANLVLSVCFLWRAFLISLLAMYLSERSVNVIDRFAVMTFVLFVYFVCWISADKWFGMLRARFFPQWSFAKLKPLDKVLTKIAYVLVVATAVGVIAHVAMKQIEVLTKPAEVTPTVKGLKGITMADVPDCKIVGCESVTVKQGTNVLHSVETTFGFRKHRVGRALKDGHHDEYRAGDKFEWTAQGRTWTFLYDGEHWHNADGNIADHEEIPFGIIDCAILTRISPDATCISLNAAYRKL